MCPNRADYVKACGGGGLTGQDRLWSLRPGALCHGGPLRRQADCLRVFVHAPLGFRVQRIAQVYDERQDSPEKRLQDKDRRRAAYYKFYTETRWGLA